MWFKNVQLFQFQEPFRLKAEQLEDKLAENILQPCGRTQLSSYGWVSPFGEKHSPLVHACNNRLLFMASKEEKLLPAAVVNEALAAKVAELEAAEGREIPKRQKRELREEIQFTLLAQAFIRSRRTAAYIDPELGLLVIDSSSRPRAEELTVLLRKSLGSLKIQEVKTQLDPRAVMSEWVLKQQYPNEIEMADSCEMLAAEKGKGVIKCAQQDLSAKEVANHLQSGKYIARLALRWADKLACVFHEDLSIKGIKFLDVIKERLEEVEAQTRAERIDADFALMSAEFSVLIKDMMEMFGGVVNPEAQPA
jgi:recombination associated protein RdgC